jgi:hypothetical protein
MLPMFQFLIYVKIRNPPTVMFTQEQREQDQDDRQRKQLMNNHPKIPAKRFTSRGETLTPSTRVSLF